MPKKIDAALRSQAVRLVTEHHSEYSSECALHIQVADSLGDVPPDLGQLDTGMVGPGGSGPDHEWQKR